jgi:hypothetical protein
MNSQRNQNQAVSLLGNITQKVSDPKKIIQYYEESFVKVLIENVKVRGSHSYFCIENRYDFNKK